MSQLFDNYIQHRKTRDLILSKKYERYRKVESYFLKKTQELNIKTSFDVSAAENPYFDTLNYTTYAEFFMIRPLSSEVAMRQIQDSLLDSKKDFDYHSMLKERIENKMASKYVNPDLVKNVVVPKIDSAVVILPGHNKFSHLSPPKMRWILTNHKYVYAKPHPLTKDEELDKLIGYWGIKRTHVLNKNSDLYENFDKYSTVYTSHISESALYAAVLGKKISPIDTSIHRAVGGFAHINHFLFSYEGEKDIINRIFSSYKSGFIDPDIHENWKERIDDYLFYIMKTREIFKNYFIEGEGKRK